MSNYANLKSAIQSVIKTNGNNEITGQLLQNELLAMITTLGYGYQFIGVASPDTVPGTPDAKVFYIAYTPGTYTNFGGIVVTGLCILKYATGWTKEDIPVSGGGTEFTVEPTDLTLVSGTPNNLKFADRPYNSTTPDGLGYKILRKDLTFAQQVTGTNTIYEIRYKFDLGNASVNVPSGCVLYFKGGELTNGTIVGQNTKIAGNKIGIFDASLNPSGSWLIDEINSRMFTTLQANNALKKLFALNNANIQTRIVIEKENYDYPVSISEDAELVFDILSNTVVEINGTIRLATNAFPHYRIFGINASNVEICGNGAIYGDAPTHIIESGSHEWGHVIGIWGTNDSFVSNIIISGILAAQGAGDSINVSYAENICIKNVICDGSRRLGISLTDVNNATIDGVIIKNISGTNPQYAIDIEPNESNAVYENIIVRNVIAENCARGTVLISSSGTDTLTKNVLIENVFDKSQTSKISLAKCANVSIIGSIVEGIAISAQNNKVIRCQCSTMSILTGYNGNVIDGCSVSTSLSVTGENTVINSILKEIGLTVIATENSIKPLLIQNNFIEYIYGYYRNVSIIGNFFAKLEDTHTKFITRQKRDYATFGVINVENNTFFIGTGKTVQRIIEVSSNGVGDNVVCKFLKNDIFALGTLSGSLVNNSEFTTFVADEQGVMSGNIPTTFALGNVEFRQTSVPALATRPTKCLVPGLSIFDTTIGKMIVYNGTGWVNMDGTPILATQGATADRPSATDAGIGFTYFDTTLGKMIVSNGTDWVNMDGTPLS